LHLCFLRLSAPSLVFSLVSARLVDCCTGERMAMALLTRAGAASSLSSSLTAVSRELGSFDASASRVLGVSNGSRVVAKLASGTKKVAKTISKVSPSRKPASGSTRDRPLWFPGAKAPSWLDGSLVGDYGFDPLSLGKSPEYLQFELDSLNQNLAKNPAGDVLGTRVDKKSSINPTPFQPYSEVFGLQRFRECELIHGRWAMLAVLGALAVETFTGVTWQDAGKVSFSFSLLSFCSCCCMFCLKCPHLRSSRNSLGHDFIVFSLFVRAFLQT
jgi:hypothetical protein